MNETETKNDMAYGKKATRKSIDERKEEIIALEKTLSILEDKKGKCARLSIVLRI